MTTSGKITCNTCGGIIDGKDEYRCDCVLLKLNGETRRVRFHCGGKFRGPFEISETGPVTQPDSDPIDNPALWRAFFAIVALVILAAFAALVIVLKP